MRNKLKKAVLFTAFMQLCLVSSAQEIPADYFREMFLRQIKNGDTTGNTSTYQFIVDNFPEDSCFNLAAVSLAQTAMKNADTPKAVRLWYEILSRPYLDGTDEIGRCDFFAFSTHHYASSSLYKFYYDIHEYDSALHYLFLSDTLFLFRTFCGMGLDDLRTWENEAFAEIYFETGEYEKAKDHLWNLVLVRQQEDIKGIAMMREIFLSQGHFKKTQRELEKGMRNLQVDSLEFDSVKYRTDFFLLPFQGRNLKVYMSHFQCPKDCGDLIPGKIYPDLFRKTKFYQMVMSLEKKQKE